MPSNTAAAATTNITLLPSSKVSRESNEKRAPRPTLGARHAYKASDAPTTIVRNAKIKSPRRGSVANECTDDKTPERTKKVPSRESEKARIAKSTVQDLKAPRFSVTANEWIKAVPTNHGMNDAFSTGSQNHQPPQPSS